MSIYMKLNFTLYCQMLLGKLATSSSIMSSRSLRIVYTGMYTGKIQMTNGFIQEQTPLLKQVLLSFS